jgi:hypothetical protein
MTAAWFRYRATVEGISVPELKALVQPLDAAR